MTVFIVKTIKCALCLISIVNNIRYITNTTILFTVYIATAESYKQYDGRSDGKDSHLTVDRYMYGGV